MFDGKRINSLEQSTITLTEDLNKANETIASLQETVVSLKNMNEALFKNIEEIVSELKSGKDESEKKYNSLANNLSGYAEKVSAEFKSMYDKCENASVMEEINTLKEHVGELEVRYSSADERHNAQIETLTRSTDALVKKCEEVQLSNSQIMNQHNEMIKKYEQNIKEYADQTQIMKNNILKKMNANNIISVVEE